jgi:hypothetical protein
MFDSTIKANIVACSLKAMGLRLLDYVLVGPLGDPACPVLPVVCLRTAPLMFEARGFDRPAAKELPRISGA